MVIELFYSSLHNLLNNHFNRHVCNITVIDFCLTKSLSVDNSTNFTTLRMDWAAKSQCIQRKGRTGRVADGKVYRLVPQNFFAVRRFVIIGTLYVKIHYVWISEYIQFSFLETIR